MRNGLKILSINLWLSCTISQWPLKENKKYALCKWEKAPVLTLSNEMKGGKGLLCCSLNMLLSHTAWHNARISSWTDASGPKQTHTHPERKTAELMKNIQVCYTVRKHTTDDIPLRNPSRKGMLLFFRAKLSSSGLQNKEIISSTMFNFYCA